jgi:hypothetical protein
MILRELPNGADPGETTMRKAGLRLAISASVISFAAAHAAPALAQSAAPADAATTDAAKF